ncbi:MAG: hypothetical protein AABW79_03090 [Nanoarchaeota archaeon]
MSFTALFLASLFISNANSQCLTSSDEFAVEVVIPDYNLAKIESLTDRNFNYYYSQAKANDKIIALFKETNQGLSLRLQLPTDAVAIEDNGFRITSTSVGKLKRPLIKEFIGWKIECSSLGCDFSKGKLHLESLFNGGEATIEIDDNLDACSEECSGKCFSVTSEQLCVDNAMQKDFDQILKFANISNDFSSFLVSYRAQVLDKPIVYEMTPTFSPKESWQTIMRDELDYWRLNGVFNISQEDIDHITSLSARGRAENYRIVYDAQNGVWNYNDQLDNLDFTSDKDCRVFSIEERTATDDKQVDLFYVIPIVLGVSALLLLVILIVVSRALDKRKRAKKKHGKGLKKDNLSGNN